MTARLRSEPAFPGKLPLPNTSGAEARDFVFFSGITVRDWFAGQAMNGICSTAPSVQCNDQFIAAEAYRIADAMLAERAKGGAA